MHIVAWETEKLRLFDAIITIENFKINLMIVRLLDFYVNKL